MLLAKGFSYRVFIPEAQELWELWRGEVLPRGMATDHHQTVVLEEGDLKPCVLKNLVQL